MGEKEFDIEKEAAAATEQTDASVKQLLFKDLPFPGSVDITPESITELANMDPENPVSTDDALLVFLKEGLDEKQRATLKQNALDFNEKA